MFKWPTPPSPQASVHELADFTELLCWQQTTTSVTAVERSLSRLGENDHSEGVQEDDRLRDVIEEVFQELDRRKVACHGSYPFQLDETGTILNAVQTVNSGRIVIYKYLLLATRLNMGTHQGSDRIQAQLDGTKLLEDLAAEACREYFGPRAESMVFGTAAEDSTFRDKVSSLCEKLREGNGYKDNPHRRTRARDGKLDVVVWKHFADGLESKLIVFGQCKTGTNYRDSLSDLQPDAFCNKWLNEVPALTPMRAFFVAEALDPADWFNTAADAGLLFDRCRILDFSSEVSLEVLGRVSTWTAAAAEAVGLPTD